jgi:hypothetical protein
MGEKNATDTSAIDAAIKKAQARKAAKAAAGTTDGGAPAKAEKTTAASKPRLTEEQKAAKAAELAKVREEQAAKRAEARSAKLAERNATRKPAHMKKVDKAAERLAPLSQAATVILNEVTHSLPAVELQALAEHIQHFNRVKATERALAQSLTEGQQVTIVGGAPRFIGKVGILAKVQRIRCYVQLEGMEKPVYLFTSDVSPVESAAPVAQAEAV